MRYMPKYLAAHGSLVTDSNFKLSFVPTLNSVPTAFWIMAVSIYMLIIARTLLAIPMIRRLFVTLE